MPIECETDLGLASWPAEVRRTWDPFGDSNGLPASPASAVSSAN